ncbi:glutathione S-transferase [Pseudidiomarina sp.]|uniref:glutathione S-transferase family protein n=1 Tax=Pseudidiomarina sp. TaxID=2081707 RepID=UPI00299CEDC0|nr:glutathione S-transferase [Pseudidiomarina sp.]MDX1706578.1 glutathione S-transferase [Pseudidiomarina sp.]
MKLFGSYTSPYVRHCRIVLAMNQQNYQLIPVDFSTSAGQSPTKRVPYFEHNGVKLHDSAPIIRYLRDLAGQPFCADAIDFDLFCMVSTAMDTEINLFLLERDGLTPEHSAYLQRQRDRIDSILADLNDRELPTEGPYTDGQLRLACYLSWAQFRQRLDIHQWPALQQFLVSLNSQPWFANTHPALS